MFGLIESDIYDIIKILEQFPDVEETIIFGSRAMGNFRKESDVDLALRGSSLKESSTGEISYLLNEETLIPYHFDEVDLNKLSNQEPFVHINEYGKVLYEKSTINLLQDKSRDYRGKKK